ncbi:hypothetical protein ACFU5O_27825 [Streptomyces sp. NPDC057445]|uniref:hypothetical protein n=1 Tax=Streptomyces sp. NPDC057445 TaxID=3346136 RepID=UPI0036BC3885
MSGVRQFHWRGMRVPFIARWSREDQRQYPIERRPSLTGDGIGYPDEDPRADRRDGVLWVRMPVVRGIGEPYLASVHALRQRQCMNHMLCQICGESTFTHSGGRHLFLMRGAKGQPIREGEKTAVPPVHEACAAEAVRLCPHLRKGWVAARVEYAPPWGVAGIVYDSQTLQPLPAERGRELEFVGLDDPRLRWTLAARDVVALHGCTPVELDELAAAAAH